MARALISLGSNLGDRQRTLAAAIAEFDSCPNLRVVATSRWRATAPIGGPAGQGEFLNGAAIVETASETASEKTLSPLDLLSVLEKIEKKFGRQRVIRWAERPLDLDLLLFDQEKISTPQLILPHPRMTFRRFVLEPAAEIAGDWQLPDSAWTIDALLANINRRPHSVTIAGGTEAQRNTLAGTLQACREELVVSCVDSQELRSVSETFQSIPHAPREEEHHAERDEYQQLDPSSDVPPTLLILLEDHDSPLTNLPAVLHLDTNDWRTLEAEALAAVLAM